MKTRYYTRDLFTEKVLSRWNNFNSRNPFTYYELSLHCIYVIRKLFRKFLLLHALNHFLPLPVMYVKGSHELKLSQREHLFHE